MKKTFLTVFICIFLIACSENKDFHNTGTPTNVTTQKESFKDFGILEVNEKDENMPEWKNFIQIKDNYESGKIVLRTYNDKGECSPITLSYNATGYTQQIDNRKNSDVSQKERVVVEQHFKYLYAIDGEDFDALMKDASMIACFVKDPAVYMHWYLANERDMNPFTYDTDMAFVIHVLK